MFKPDKYIHPDFSKEIFVNAPEAKLEAAPKDKTAPEGYHAMSIFPEYFKIDGQWLLAEESRMDCVPVYENGKIFVREFRNLNKGDLVVIGRTEDASEGIYVHENCFEKEEKDEINSFTFRQGRTRETGFSHDYEQLVELLKYEKENGGYIVWTMGPACSFDVKARENFAKLIDNGYVQALLAGNALATHDLEGGYLATALGADIKTQMPYPNGHYNHLDTINRVRYHGSIEKFIKEEKIDSGIIAACVRNNVPFVLTGSIRDDGPLPEVFGNCYEGQDNMRAHVRKATTVIGMASVLHTIATGNMTPMYRMLDDGTIRPLYFYMVDTSEFAANKLSDRGSLTSKGIVTNVQDFMRNVVEGLGL